MSQEAQGSDLQRFPETAPALSGRDHCRVASSPPSYHVHCGPAPPSYEVSEGLTGAASLPEPLRGLGAHC